VQGNVAVPTFGDKTFLRTSLEGVEEALKTHNQSIAEVLHTGGTPEGLLEEGEVHQVGFASRKQPAPHERIVLLVLDEDFDGLQLVNVILRHVEFDALVLDRNGQDVAR